MGTPSTIDRYQFSSTFNSGPASGTFFDNICIEDPLAVDPPTNAYTQVQSEVAFISFQGLAGQDYQVEVTADPVAGPWTRTDYTFQGRSGGNSVFDPTGLAAFQIYRLVVK